MSRRTTSRSRSRLRAWTQKWAPVRFTGRTRGTRYRPGMSRGRPRFLQPAPRSRPLIPPPTQWRLGVRSLTIERLVIRVPTDTAGAFRDAMRLQSRLLPLAEIWFGLPVEHRESWGTSVLIWSDVLRVETRLHELIIVFTGSSSRGAGIDRAEQMLRVLLTPDRVFVDALDVSIESIGGGGRLDWLGDAYERGWIVDEDGRSVRTPPTELAGAIMIGGPGANQRVLAGRIGPDGSGLHWRAMFRVGAARRAVAALIASINFRRALTELAVDVFDVIEQDPLLGPPVRNHRWNGLRGQLIRAGLGHERNAVRQSNRPR